MLQTSSKMDAIGEAQAYIEALERRVKELEQQKGHGAPPPSKTPDHLKSPSYRVVIKVGTSSLVHQKNGIKLAQVAAIMETVAALRRANHSVLLVTSGAVGTGAHELGIVERPNTVTRKQALAAVGQVRLMRELNSMLSTLGVSSAQVLLTYGNLSERQQSLNAQNTIEELFRLGVVPVVNENDTVATEEIRFGDNDRLSAMVACLVNAHMLFLLTDVNGLYTANPNVDPNAKRIEIVPDVQAMRSQVRTDSGPGSEFSTGGMESKLQAALIATRGGVRTVIMAAADVRKLPPFVDECMGVPASGAIPTAPFGTVCVESNHPVKGRKRWIQSLPARGKVVLDQGASEAMKMRKTLFAAGVVQVEGKFGVLEPVSVVSQKGERLAVGLCNFSSTDLAKIMGKRTEEIAEILGMEAQGLAVIDRDNLAWDE
jgi:glutamate 5-kinase